jgi:hypothetical protein
MLILLASAGYLASPAYAQGVVISVSPSVTTSYMGATVVVNVNVQNNDLTVPSHTIQLSLVSGGYGWWPASFGFPTLTVGMGLAATTSLTIPVPGPESICPGTTTPGPYYVAFTVQGKQADAFPAVSITPGSLAVNLMVAAVPVSVEVVPSKSSYIVGETVSLAMNANVPAEYNLKIMKPDGSTWGSAHGILPATYTKKATEPLGTYTAELVAAYCGTAYASASFSVTPDTYEVTVSFSGLPADVRTTLQVDGSKVADMNGGDVRVLTYPIGSSHTFQVDQYVNGAPGYRYYCASNTWTANAQGSNVFNYVTQVNLEVSTDPTGVTDVTTSGWYALGSSATISPVPTEVEPTEGTKYVFTTWTVDGTPRSGNGFPIVMDAPHKVVAKFDTMYLLTIASDYGNPQGGRYYKSGETATFSVNTPVGFGIQQVFVEWKGDYSGKDPKGSLIMDGPKTVAAVWTTSYLQLYMIVGVIAVIAAVAGLLLWRRSRAGPSAVKPPPPPPPTPAEAPEAKAEPSAPTAEAATPSKRAVTVAFRCTNCGHELKQGQTYCPECGQKQTD